MGSRLHLRVDRRRLAICRCCLRPVLAACGGLVDAADDDGTVGHGRPAHGRLPPQPSSRSAASFRSGSQYTSEDFQRLLESHGVVCSMSRRVNCWDNAAMESFFSTLKTERLSKKHYRTRDDLRADVFDNIAKGSTIHAGVIPLSATSAQHSLKI